MRILTFMDARAVGLVIVSLALLGREPRPAAASQCHPTTLCEDLFHSTTFVGIAAGTVATSEPGVVATTFVVTETLHVPVPLANRVTIRHGIPDGSNTELALITGREYADGHAHGRSRPVRDKPSLSSSSGAAVMPYLRKSLCKYLRSMSASRAALEMLPSARLMSQLR